jgi:hypothetical protein
LRISVKLFVKRAPAALKKSTTNPSIALGILNSEIQNILTQTNILVADRILKTETEDIINKHYLTIQYNTHTLGILFPSPPLD